MGVRSYPVAIVGAGIAGAAAAWHLAQRGIGPVLLIERDSQAGGRSTARNAAILRTAISDPALHALARESADFYRRPPSGFSPVPLIDPVGLVLAASAEHASTLRAWTSDPAQSQGATEYQVDALREAHPQLSENLAYAVRYATEGTLDVDAILQALLRQARAAGMELRTNCSVEGLLRSADGALCGLRTDGGEIYAEQVILAGGGWADEPVAADGLSLGLHPRRRHLLVTGPDSSVDPRGPVVWLQGEEFYFRPESGGMLLSACDDEIVPPDEGESAQDAILERIASQTARWLPGLAGADAAHFWAGTRTFAPNDQRFVIGPDPRLKGLHWLAALGGHGISCGYAAGRLCADGIVDACNAHPAFTPARLLQPTKTTGRSARCEATRN